MPGSTHAEAVEFIQIIFLNEHRTKEEKNKIAFPIVDPRKSYNRPFTIEELSYSLRKFSSKAPGPGNIPIRFIKEIPLSKLPCLLAFYNFIWENGFPHQWRSAVVIPILKVGKPAKEIESYRPIALTSSVCKVMERIVVARLQQFLVREKILAKHQSGFRAGHSTMDALSILETDVRRVLNQDDFCLCVLMDISNSFDTVWHHGLLEKLKNMKVEGQLPSYIQHFHTALRIRVKNEGILSETYPLTASVPKGAVLSPTLVNVIINDIFIGCPNSLEMSLFADDGAM